MSKQTTRVEGKLPVPGGEVWYRRMGSGGTPLLLLHGGPGFPCDVLFDAFEPIASEREVIWYDQLGVGRSDPIEDPSLLAVERFLDELDAVIDGLGLQRPHIYGHSWGAMFGLQHAAERAPGWTSFICASPFASIPRAGEEIRTLMAKLPGNVLQRVYGRELTGQTDDPDYLAAFSEFWKVHVLHNPNPPASWAHCLNHISWITVKTMFGHGEHHVVGTLKDWDIFAKLERIKTPTLVWGGEFDQCIPAHLADIARRIPDSEHVTQPGASHMPYIEEPPVRDRHVSIVQDYIARIEARGRR
jgi:proline-specific peptidase